MCFVLLPHKIFVVREYLVKKQVHHPSYSLNLSVYDYFLFPKMKITIKWTLYDNIEITQVIAKIIKRWIYANGIYHPKDGFTQIHSCINLMSLVLYWYKRDIFWFLVKQTIIFYYYLFKTFDFFWNYTLFYLKKKSIILKFYNITVRNNYSLYKKYNIK